VFSGEIRVLTSSGPTSVRSIVEEESRISESDRTQSRMSDACTLTQPSV